MGAHGASSHSLSRSILQHQARAEEAEPLRVIAVEAEAARGLDLKSITLAEAAKHLVVVDAHGHDDLSGVNVVHIPPGQKEHPLYENAETRRRSRMLG